MSTASRAKAAAGRARVTARRHAPDHDLATDNRGQSNLVGLFIGLLIAGIVAIRVFIPVISNAIADSNVSGTTESVLDLLPLFAGLLLLVALAAPLMRRI